MSAARAQQPSMNDTPIVGSSPALLAAVARAARFARSTLPVLLVGPTGSGKELFARHVHRLSGRTGSLVDVDCAAIPRDMVESILFGHRRGAFTGAVDSSVGLVSAAHGGTLFLDEICSLPLEGQAKLLRTLETGEIRRLGDTAKIRVDFRLVAAAREDLRERVAAGEFREDLYHRINGVSVAVPGLAERPSDISELARYFLDGHGRTLCDDAAVVLESLPWRGNVRQLKRVMERAALLAERDDVDAAIVTEALAEEDSARAERTHGYGAAASRGRAELRAVCAANAWDVQRITSALRISRATLFRRLRAAGLSLREPRSLGRVSGESHRSRDSAPRLS